MENNIIDLKNKIKTLREDLKELEEELKEAKTKRQSFESVSIVNTNTTLKDFEEIIENYKKIISNDYIQNIDKIGIKKLAYEIQKQKEGYYVVIKFEATNQIVLNLERYLRANKNIIKFITIRNYEED